MATLNVRKNAKVSLVSSMNMSRMTKKSGTPAILPFIAPGKVSKEESFNRYVHKKNSKGFVIDPGTIDKNRKVSRSNSEGDLTKSQKSDLKGKIKDIFDEDEKDGSKKEKKGGEVNKRSSSEERPPKSRGRPSAKGKTRKDKKSKSRSPKKKKADAMAARSKKDEGYSHSEGEVTDSEEDSGSDVYDSDGSEYDEDSDEDDQYDETEVDSPAKLAKTADVNVWRNKRWDKEDKNNKLGPNDSFRRRSTADTHTSGLGSLVEDLEDRYSIGFVDNLDEGNPHIVDPNIRRQRPDPQQEMQQGYGQQSSLQNKFAGYLSGPQGQPTQQQVYGGGDPGLGQPVYPQLHQQQQQQQQYPPQGEFQTLGPGQFQTMGPGEFQTLGPGGFNSTQQGPNFRMQPSYTNGPNHHNGGYDSLPPNGYNNRGGYKTSNSSSNFMPSHLTTAAPSPYGWKSVNLDQSRTSRRSAPEAWIVFSKEGNPLNPNGDFSDDPLHDQTRARKLQAKPISFGGSIGSQLKKSFTNINKSRSTPVQKFEPLREDDNRKGRKKRKKREEDDDLSWEERRSRKRKVAVMSAVATAVGLIILAAVIIGGAVAVTKGGTSSSNSGDETAASTNNDASGGGTKTGGIGGVGVNFGDNTPCVEYIELSDSWRNIAGGGIPTVREQGYHCDMPRTATGKGIKDDWYRFTGAAGTYMATSPPGRETCGTSKVGWMNGNHPLLREGTVQRTFCFHWESSCESEFEGSVRTCEDSSGGSYYVYNLKVPPQPSCYYAFCAL